LEKEEFEKIVKEVIELVKDVPDEYRHLTYQVLLAQRLQGSKPASGETGVKGAMPWTSSVHAEVKAFLKRNDISQEVLENLFLPDGESFVPAYSITTPSSARAQIQIACLASLEHALRDGVFEFSCDDIRRRLTNFGLYDKDHFRAPFKKNRNLFRSFNDLEHIQLTSLGVAELARVIGETTS